MSIIGTTVNLKNSCTLIIFLNWFLSKTLILTILIVERKIPIIINSINGGFRVSADIQNIGTAIANNVNWSIDLDGGLILSGSHSEGVIDELGVGETKTIRQDILYGIGRTTITVTAGDATKQATAFILGPLVLGINYI